MFAIYILKVLSHVSSIWILEWEEVGVGMGDGSCQHATVLHSHISTLSRIPTLQYLSVRPFLEGKYVHSTLSVYF